MQNVMSEPAIVCEEHRIECANFEENHGVSEKLNQEKDGENGQSLPGDCAENDDPGCIRIVISDGESENVNPAVLMSLETRGDTLKVTGNNQLKGEVTDVVGSHKKVDSLSRDESSREQCRVCQQSSEEALIDLGCQCRGGLAKAHLSCIGIWFSTRGSNKCEICQQIAVNVPPPESQPSRNYWIWRIDPGAGNGQGQGRERGCYSPLWVALSILIGGLLLDVLISISLGVSALPVNIIIGVLVVLGLGTALRLAFECCREISMRRAVQRMDINANPNYHPTIWQNL
ncbi:hypothetical protein MKW94_021289 [Papaver nudicaule]|uniref:RING-CH-type domain-containing protein n=1 Tax=Papaver nudicaule TaxID=74823 RepID=A0AA41V854_PAPNU|nr:hypothetical protein [Papaver nudicaule]